MSAMSTQKRKIAKKYKERMAVKVQATPSDPFGDEESLKLLYAEFEQEAVALANEGLPEFRQVMSEYDGE